MSQYDAMEAHVRAHAGVSAEEFDAGLRSYMLKVYNYMAAGLAITAAVAAFAASNEAFIVAYMTSPLKWVLFAVIIGFGWLGLPRLATMQPAMAQGMFWGFTALMGLWLAPILVVYTGTSVARTFAITAAMFGAMSLWGYTTKKDLTSMGSFLFMGMIGLFIGFLVNMFIGSTIMHLAMSAIGVVIFAVMAAYDTQAIKSVYLQGMTEGRQEQMAVMGASHLYMSFINLFLMLLQFFGAADD